MVEQILNDFGESSQGTMGDGFFSDLVVHSKFSILSKFFGDFSGYSVIFRSKFFSILDGFETSHLATLKLVLELII